MPFGEVETRSTFTVGWAFVVGAQHASYERFKGAGQEQGENLPPLKPNSIGCGTHQ